MSKLPRPFILVLVGIVVLAMIPPAIIVRMRTTKQTTPRIHWVQDMDNQPKFRAQHANAMFADGRAMRQPVTGTVARGELRADAHFNNGVVDEAWATTFPPQSAVTPELLARGQQRFAIYCTPCHGQTGYGDGLVNQRALTVMNDPFRSKGTTWVEPKSIHDQDIIAQPVGQLFNTITNGVRTMAGYQSRISVQDRWAIIAHMRELQRLEAASGAGTQPEESATDNPTNDAGEDSDNQGEVDQP